MIFLSSAKRDRWSRPRDASAGQKICSTDPSVSVRQSVSVRRGISDAGLDITGEEAEESVTSAAKKDQ